MRVWSRLCSVVAWAMLVVALIMQVFSILALWMPPWIAAAFPNPPVYDKEVVAKLPFLLTGTVLFCVGYFLFRFMRRGRWIWFTAMLIGAAMIAGVGLYFKSNSHETILANDITAGYTPAKLFLRHFTPVVTVVFHFLAVLLRQIAEGRELRREALAEIKAKGVEPKYE